MNTYKLNETCNRILEMGEIAIDENLDLVKIGDGKSKYEDLLT